MLNAQKELTPVFYGDSAVKILPLNEHNKEELCFEMHWHERMELIYVIKGSLLIHTGSKKNIVGKGCIAVISPEQPHYGVSGPYGVSYYTIMFDLTRFYNKTPIVERLLKPLVEKTSEFSEIINEPQITCLLDLIINDRKLFDETSALIEVGRIYQLLGLLYRFCLVIKQSNTISNGRFRDVLDYVNHNFCDNISSSYLSKKFGYDKAYFCRRFKATTGLSPTIYIRILRLEKSKSMLTDSESTISEIALCCGFSDSGYFSKCFKKHYGILPKDIATHSM